MGKRWVGIWRIFTRWAFLTVAAVALCEGGADPVAGVHVPACQPQVPRQGIHGLRIHWSRIDKETSRLMYIKLPVE